MLYSHKESKWKLADFGISTEATSKRALTTIFSAGTSGYRAPELLAEDPKYTNKVDMWALGCILYELVFEKKAFTGDWEVFEYRATLSDFSKFPFPELLPSWLQTHISNAVKELLHIEWERRPRSSDVHTLFSSYGHLLNISFVRTINDLPYAPDYYWWKNLVLVESAEARILVWLGQWYSAEGLYDLASLVWTE